MAKAKKELLNLEERNIFGSAVFTFKKLTLNENPYTMRISYLEHRIAEINSELNTNRSIFTNYKLELIRE